MYVLVRSSSSRREFIVSVLVSDREAGHLDWCHTFTAYQNSQACLLTSCPQVVRVLAPDLLARLQEELQVRRPSAA